MAVDTPGKRFSMMSFGRGPRAFPLPIPDGSFDDGDRAHLLGLYSGISLVSIKPAPFFVVAAMVAVPGAIACQVAVPGAIEGQVAVPGAIACEVAVPGAVEGQTAVPGAIIGQVTRS